MGDINIDPLSKYSKEAVDLVREFRHQAANLVIAEFRGDELVEVSKENYVDALAHAYDVAGSDEGIFVGLKDFYDILEILEAQEPDPNCYECEEYQVFIR